MQTFRKGMYAHALRWYIHLTEKVIIVTISVRPENESISWLQPKSKVASVQQLWKIRNKK